MLRVQFSQRNRLNAEAVHGRPSHRKTAILTLMLALLSWAIPSIAGSDTVHAAKDSYVRISNNGPWGSNVRIRVDNDGGSGSRILVGVVQFRVNQIRHVEKAELLLDLETFVGSGSANFSVWGVSEGASFEEWDEDDLKYNDFDGLLDGSSDCVAKFSWRIWGTEPLANLTVTPADKNKTVGAGSALFGDFLEANENHVVTLLIARNTINHGMRTAFASKEHDSLNPPRLFVTVKDLMYTPQDDTYVRKNDSGTHGHENDIVVKKSGNGSGDTVRKGLLEFRIVNDKVIVAKNATLLLDLSWFNDSAGSTSSRFYVWGIKNDTSLEHLYADATYNDFSNIFDNSSDGTTNDKDHLFDGNPSSSGAQALGTFTVYASDMGKTVTFTSPAMVDFINDNDNWRISFAITRLTNSGSLNTFFASKEHPSLNPPRLHIQPQLEEGVSNYDAEFIYMDVDHDSDKDLVLVVNEPEGGGFATAEPFVIANYMDAIGIGLGDGDAFYQKLSPSQKQSLHNALYTIANNDCVQQTVAAALTANQINAALNSLPAEREYPVTNFSVRANLKAEVSNDSLTLVVELGGCTLYEYSHGDLTVTIGGPSAQAGFYVSDGGIAFGGEYAVIAIGLTYGNTDGSYVGVNASYGNGFWFAASWGDKDQYGFSSSIPGTPVGVSLYIKGSDVVDIYNEYKYVGSQGAYLVRNWYEDDWADQIDWSQYVFVSMKNSAAQTKVFMERNSNYAKMWVEDAGRQSLVELEGSASQVTNGLEDAADSITHTSSNIAGSLENWADDAGSVVVSLWNDSSGWVKGAANSVGNGIKQVIGWF